MRVRVYWNLHKKCWSVQSTQTNLVVLHANHLWLDKCKFMVRPAGQRRVREEGKKNVHAFVVGNMTSGYEECHFQPHGCKVSYNPYENDTFMCSGDPIYTAMSVEMLTDKEGRPKVYVMRG